MSVDFKHPDYKTSLPKWTLVNDICDSLNLKNYLIKRNPDDKSARNVLRNEQIFKRAVFSAIAGYTSRGFVGQIFAKEPKIKLPPELEYLKEDCDGSGTPIYQQSQDSSKDTIRIGRAGLFTDFPLNEDGEEVSKAALDSGEVFATINKYEAAQIINWKESRIGAKNKVSLIVLALSEDLDGPDGFTFESVPLRIELRLMTDELGPYFAVQEWRLSVENKEEWIPGGFTSPLLDGFGRRWDKIPFNFIGSESNTPKVDQPPMYDISSVNAGHFNNSAIYEDSVFIVGQPQPWMSGLNQSQIDLLKDNNMYFGSGNLIGVPTGEKLDIAQVQPNTMAKEAMESKLEMIIGLGGMFIQPGSAVKTATQSGGEQRIQHSVLSLISSNVSDAYLESIKDAGRYMGIDAKDEDYEFSLNKDFSSPATDAQTLTAMFSGYQTGSVTPYGYFKWSKKVDLARKDQTQEEFLDELGSVNMPDLDAE